MEFVLRITIYSICEWAECFVHRRVFRWGFLEKIRLRRYTENVCVVMRVDSQAMAKLVMYIYKIYLILLDDLRLG